MLIAPPLAPAPTVHSYSLSKEEGRNSVDAAESAESMPRDLLIDSGDLNNRTGLNPSYKLNRSNGKYLNLYVENRGSTSILTDHMMMEATELGLGTVWICYFQPDMIREAFGLPDNLEPINILAVGYSNEETARFNLLRRIGTDTVPPLCKLQETHSVTSFLFLMYAFSWVDLLTSICYDSSTNFYKNKNALLNGKSRQYLRCAAGNHCLRGSQQGVGAPLRQEADRRHRRLDFNRPHDDGSHGIRYSMGEQSMKFAGKYTCPVEAALDLIGGKLPGAWGGIKAV